MVLITGGAGYIGGTTARYLIEQGEDVVILDSLVSSNIEDVPNGAVFYKGDVADTELVIEIVKKHKIDACLHFAAFIEVAESVINPYIFVRVNSNVQNDDIFTNKTRIEGYNKTYMVWDEDDHTTKVYEKEIEVKKRPRTGM